MAKADLSEPKPFMASVMDTFEPKPIVWTIAGSDSGGGAGIQADLATMQDLGCHACSVISTVTAQSSVAVTLVEGVSEAMLLTQLNTLLTDMPPKAIKIGLLSSQAQLKQVANWLKDTLTAYQSDMQCQVPVILDPVMLASCGDALNAQNALDFECFKGLLTLLTPNAIELGLLVDKPLPSASACLQAAKELALRFDCAVLAKGGDAGGTWDPLWAHDVFVCGAVPEVSIDHQNSGFLLTNERVDTHNNHGTGCTLSSAIAAVMASGFVLHDAIVVAKAYVSAGLKASYQLGSGAGVLARLGWPSHLSDFPSIVMLGDDKLAVIEETKPHDAHQYMAKSLLDLRYQGLCQGKASQWGLKPVSLRQIDKPFTPINGPLGLYPVVDDVDMLASLLAAGTQTIQLRVKDSDDLCLEDKSLEDKIIQAVALGKQYEARVFINDHWQLAIKHGAYGVHLGQEDLAFADLQALSAANVALGVSSHSYFELLLASQLSPSYLALGHIFPTTTKVMPSLPQGLNKLSRYVSLMKGHYPLVAIGGIDESRLEQVKATGVDDIAVVRAVTQATSPADAFSDLSLKWSHA